jgi:predicted DNA-binding transcriptional regulator AlpA
VDGYLTTREAAELLGIAERSMYYYLRDREKNGFPEPRRFGRALMWPEAPLRQWREEHPARRRSREA